MRTDVKSASRVLDLLELMAVLPHPVRLNEAVRRLGIPKSSASALFSTLERKGYVTSGRDGYVLAEPFRNGGWTGGHYAHLSRVSRPVMMRLVEETGESAFLGIMTSDWSVQYVDKITSTNAVRYDVDLSESRPAYNTSVGHVFLASKSDEELEHYLATQPFRKITPYTIADPRELRLAIQKVRQLGYAEAERSNDIDSAGVSAGIVSAAGRTIATVSIVAPAARFAQVRDKAIVAVTAAAARISEALQQLPRSHSTSTKRTARGK